MRICYIASAKSIHTQRWVDYFAKKGHEVHIITSWLGDGYAKSVKLHFLPSPLPQYEKGSGYINSLLWVILVRRLISRIKPDIIDAHYITVNGYLGALSGFRPLVLTAWGSDVLIVLKENLRLRILVRYALKRARMITCNSETVRRELVNFGANPDRLEIIRQGIETQKFSPRRVKGFKKRLGLQGTPIVISTRSFEPVYNSQMLIRAIPLVLEHSPQASFLIAGEGKQREHLENLASSLGCSKNIRFVGQVAHDELPKYLAVSDIYVSVSLSDSASLSLHEAMACELAPVVTDLSGNREWITDGENGFLVPVNDIQALVDKICYLLENKGVARKFGMLGRKIIQERAEYEKEMGRMEKLYERIIAKDKPTGQNYTKTMNLGFICPECRSGLQPRRQSYYCPECSKEYPYHIVNDTCIIDFKSLDTTDCKCNRDGRSVCTVDLRNQIPNYYKTGTAKKNYTVLKHPFTKEEFGCGNRILDLGCAESPFSHLFTGDNESYGLDNCPKRILLNENNALHKGYQALIVGEGLSIPFPDSSFDIIICTEVIEHVVEIRQLINEINRVLRKGGKLILSTPNLVSLGNRLGMICGKGLKFNLLGFWQGGPYPLTSWSLGKIPGKQYSFDSIRYPEQPLHVRFFTFESLRKLLKYSGFSVKEEIGRDPVLSKSPSFVSRICKNWADSLLVIATKD